MLRALKISLSIALVVVLVVVHLPSVHSTPLVLSPRYQGLEHGSDHLGEGKLGAVASESALCSHHGTEMLKKGGNAADAVSTISLWTWEVSAKISDM
jgi:gamma-glutamyltranspeptidase/glutathione hydrolase